MSNMWPKFSRFKTILSLISINFTACRKKGMTLKSSKYLHLQHRHLISKMNTVMLFFRDIWQRRNKKRACYCAVPFISLSSVQCTFEWIVAPFESEIIAGLTLSTRFSNTDLPNLNVSTRLPSLYAVASLGPVERNQIRWVLLINQALSLACLIMVVFSSLLSHENSWIGRGTAHWLHSLMWWGGFHCEAKVTHSTALRALLHACMSHHVCER